MKKNEHAGAVFGNTLREIRVTRRMSQEEVALEAEIDRTFLSRVENGKLSPSFDSILAIATALGVSLTQLSQKFENNMGKPGHEKSTAE